MEVYFVDVGQGTCNVISHGRREAIVIDCGRRGREILRLLHHLNIDSLPFLIVSHNDSDHSSAASSLLRQFRGRLGTVCLLQDHKLFKSRFWRTLTEELDSGHLSISQLIRLESDQEPRLLFSDEPSQLSLRVFAPLFGENLVAQEKREANATSGVLVLDVGQSRVVFPGDSTSAQWRTIRNARKKLLQCSILAVPHHGGAIHNSREDLDWLYEQAIRPRFAIISASTSNKFNHPREDVVSVLRQNGARVICTQVTSRCASDLERFRIDGLSITLPGRSQATKDLTADGQSRNIACAGTILAEVAPKSVKIGRLDEHKNAIDHLCRITTDGVIPLCRRSGSST